MMCAEEFQLDAEPSKPVRWHKIVVGVNGSVNSINAVRLAVEKAMRSDAAVDVVCAFRAAEGSNHTQECPKRLRDTSGPGLVMPAPPPYDVAPRVAAEAAAFATAARCVQTALAHETPAIRIRIVPTAGRPQDVLVESARSADLLVVGECVHAADPTRAAESTPQSCIREAECPVLVVGSDDLL